MKHAEVVARAVVVNEENHVLLLRRAKTDDRRPGTWDFPGGMVEDDEDFTAAVAREIEEETGFRIGHHALHLFWADSTIDEDQHICRLFFIGYTDQTQVRLSAEHDEFLWTGLDEAIEIHDYPRQKKLLEFVRDSQLLA